MKTPGKLLLEWYRSVRVPYPWRQTQDPYKVWLSEVLLQQTRIPVALPFYERIVSQYPTLQSLASANPSTFVAAWSGIGYYRRATNMLECARLVLSRHDGRFPRDEESLLRLPGIGKYTAGALRNLCFDQLSPAIDGNVSRVLARLAGIRDLYGSREFQEKIGKQFLELGRGLPSSEYFQSLMELGERICTPHPGCLQCPVTGQCIAYRDGTQESLPVRPAKEKPREFYWHFLLLKKKEAVLFAIDSNREFLKNAWLLPDIFSSAELDGPKVRKRFEKKLGWELRDFRMMKRLRHSVTFRKIHVHVYTAKISGPRTKFNGKWLTMDEMKDHPTSSVTMKVLKATGEASGVDKPRRGR